MPLSSPRSLRLARFALSAEGSLWAVATDSTVYRARQALRPLGNKTGNSPKSKDLSLSNQWLTGRIRVLSRAPIKTRTYEIYLDYILSKCRSLWRRLQDTLYGVSKALIKVDGAKDSGFQLQAGDGTPTGRGLSSQITVASTASDSRFG